MPMYEYGCKTCAKTFDLLRRMNQSDEGIVCPHCGENHIQRKLSTFAAFTRSSGGSSEPQAVASMGGGCACSSGGSCGCSSN